MRHYTIQEMEQMNLIELGTLFDGKRLNYNILEPKEGLITIEFRFERNNELVSDTENSRKIDNFSVEYYYIGEDYDSRLAKGELRNCYLKNVIASKKIEINTLDAEASFWDGNISFLQAKFADGGASFKYAQFGKGNVSFERSAFGKGEVLFVETQFGEGNVSFENANFGNGKVSFEKAHFEKGNIFFRGASISEGTVDFANTSYGEGDVIFDNVNFGTGNVNFTNADFGNGNVTFDFANFQGNVMFRSSRFGKGDISFEKTKFNKGNISFIFTDFGDGDICFKATDFGESKVSFWNVKFGRGNLCFEVTKCANGEIGFTEIDFDKMRVSFESIRHEETRIYFRSIKFTEVFFSFSKFKSCEFEEVVFCNRVHFEKSSGQKIIFNKCILENDLVLEDISEIVFQKNMLKNITKIKNCHTISFPQTTNLGIIDLNWDELNLKNSFVGDDRTQQLVLLKENYHNLGQYDWEDKAFVEYMRTKRKQEKSYSKKIVNWFVDTIGEYGTNPGRVAITMLLTWLAFGAVFEILFQNVFGIDFLGNTASNLINMHYGDGFYYSAITFLTMSYNIIPVHPAIKILAPIEGILGLFLMSYFTVALVRKTLR